VTRTRIDYRHSKQANRYRRQGSIWEILLFLEKALPEGGVGGGAKINSGATACNELTVVQ